MDNIQIVKAVQIIGVNDTNSLPLQVLCGDNEIYIIKTMFKKHPPIEDIINEILSNYFLQCWKISVPDQALVLVNDTLIEQYVKSGNKIDKKYEEFLFNDHYFYGSKFLPNATELDLYNLNLKNKYDFKKYENPLDLIKIGLYDIWIGNKDRRSDNPNLLLESSSTAFKIIPIDNTQTFANQSCYKALNLAVMDMNNEKSILTTPLSKSICNFANSKDYINLAKEVLLGIENSLDSANAIFENIPSQLGLSKMGKERIKLILSDKDRNNKISQLHLNYQK